MFARAGYGQLSSPRTKSARTRCSAAGGTVPYILPRYLVQDECRMSNQPGGEFRWWTLLVPSLPDVASQVAYSDPGARIEVLLSAVNNEFPQ